MKDLRKSLGRENFKKVKPDLQYFNSEIVDILLIAYPTSIKQFESYVNAWIEMNALMYGKNRVIVYKVGEAEKCFSNESEKNKRK